MRKVKWIAAVVVFTAFGVGATATAASAMVPSEPPRVCDPRGIVASMQGLRPSLDGPLVLNLQASCTAP